MTIVSSGDRQCAGIVLEAGKMLDVGITACYSYCAVMSSLLLVYHWLLAHWMWRKLLLPKDWSNVDCNLPVWRKTFTNLQCSMLN